MKKNKTHGSKGAIFIILTILVTAFILVFIASLNIYVNKNMTDAGLYYEENKAYMAALAGIEYAKMRIEQNSGWEGNNSANNIINKDVSNKKISIYENWTYNKCVKGEIKDKTNSRDITSFYITFSNPPLANVCKYVSYNNCTSKDDLRDDTGGLNTTQTTIPAGAVLLIVKGESRGRAVYVESGFIYAGGAGINRPLIASKEISAKTEAKTSPEFIVDASDLLTPMMYSRYRSDSMGDESLRFQNMNVDLSGGEAETFGSYYSGAGLSDTNTQTNTDNRIPNLDLDKVKQAQLDSWPANNSLKAGDYVVMQGDNFARDRKYKIVYAAGSVTKTYTPDLNNVPTASGGEKLTGIKLEGSQLKIQEPQKVSPFDSEKNITIRGEGISNRVKVIMDKTGEKQPYIINEESEGGITISGELSGTGGVYANGDVTFEGKSMMNTTVDSGVGIFAGGKVILKDISAADQDTGSFNSVFNKYADKFYKNVTSFNRLPSVDTKLQLANILLTDIKFTSGPTRKRNTVQAYKNYLKTFTDTTTKSLSANFNIFNAWLLNKFDFTANDSVFYGLIYSKKGFEYFGNNKFALFGSIVVNGGNLKFSDLNSEKNQYLQRVVVYYDPSYLKVLNDQGLYVNCKLAQKFTNKL